MIRTNSAYRVIFALYSLVCGLMLPAQNTSFHGAPTSAEELAPPSTAGSAPAHADAETSSEPAPPPKPPFTDYRFEKPGQIHKITLKDLPAPFDTPSASNGPTIVPRPQDAWPKAPAGFEVTLSRILAACGALPMAISSLRK